MKAVGIHVFAGGFSYGVSKRHEVVCQLEQHNFGLETANDVFGIETVNHKDAKWPHVEADWSFGNPRCTGFSTITSGYAEDCHGPWAKQTQDIHRLMEYAINRYDLVIWESVQQAFTVGRPLLDYLRDEVCEPNHYRVAHVMLNAASFGNSQQRKRYFFVAYRDNRTFNVEPPQLGPEKPLLYHAIWDLRDRPNTRPAHLWCRDAEYDFDCHAKLTPAEDEDIRHLPGGMCFNALGRWNHSIMSKKHQQTWNLRVSDMPFSMHGCYRTQWLCPCPTLHSSAGRFIHPHHHRPLTVGEIATIMGWEGKIPVGPNPIGQIVKGIVPEIGTWLSRQAELYLTGAWGEDDWYTKYDDNKGEWVGGNAKGMREKELNLTRYAPKSFDRDNYPSVIPIWRYYNDPDPGKRCQLDLRPNIKGSSDRARV